MRKCKHILMYILIISIIFVFPSCKNSEDNSISNKNQENRFDIKAAENIVNTYMKYLMKEDYVNANKLYSKKLKEDVLEVGNQNLKIKGFNIGSINEIGRGAIFKVKVTRMSSDKVYSSLDEYSIKVIKEKSDYKVSNINNVTEKEIFSDDNQLRIKYKDNVDTNLVININAIPNYIFTKQDKTKTNKIVVPKKNFGNMAFSYVGDSIAISTYDKDSFAGIVKIDESMETQKTNDSEEETSKEGSGGGKNDKQGVKEKPIGKEFIPLDLIKDSKIEYMSFSQDEKFVLIQYKNNKAGRSIRVYKTEDGEIIPYLFEENYSINKVDVKFSSFDKDVLNFEVIPQKKSDKSVGKYIGRWQISLKDFKVQKL